MWVCLCVCVWVSVYACVHLFDVCVSSISSDAKHGMTKVATPLLASSSSLGRPIGAPRVFQLEILVVASLGSLVSGGSAYICVPDGHDTL